MNLKETLKNFRNRLLGGGASADFSRCAVYQIPPTQTILSQHTL